MTEQTRRAVPRSARILFKHWKLCAISSFSLAVAMAVGILGLSVINTILILAPSAPEPDRLLTVYSRSPSNAYEQISYPDYQYFRENNHVFSALAASPNSIRVDADINFEGREVKVTSRPVSVNYFTVLGIRPHLGAFFAPTDNTAKARVAVMTYSCWKRLGSDLNIVGKVLSGHTILGVTPKDFGGSFWGINGDLFTTLVEAENNGNQRGDRRLFLTGRLKPGVTRQQAEVELAALSGQLATAYPDSDKNRVALVTRATLLPPDTISTARLMGAILMTLVMLIVLIACANVANLLLAVAVGRRQEAAIKLALGASRWRLIREFLLESTLLCAVGAAIGWGVAATVIQRFSDVTVALPMIGVFSFSLNLRLDGAVVALTLVLMVVASLTSGLPPALYASSPALSQILVGETAVGGTRKGLRRDWLVGTQIAVCTLVLVGMGLCESSLYKLQRVDLGFKERNLAAVTVYLEAEGYDEARGKVFQRTLRQTVSEIPGVESVSLASDVPLFGATEVPVQLPNTDNKTISIAQTVVDDEYFRTVGVPVLSGRWFLSSDGEKSPLVCVINQRMASLLWPGQDVLGKIVEAGEPPARKFTVVGTVADGRHLGLSEDPKPFFYWALSQHYVNGVSFIARTKGDPNLWLDPLKKALRGLNLKIMVQPMTFQNWMNFTLFAERFTTGCVAVLSGLGLMLAVIGLFASISYSVRARRKELGIRVALGAAQGQLLRMILRQTSVVAGVGVGVGMVMGVVASFVLRSQLFGIASVELVVLVPVALAMLALCLVVAYVSARPWLKLDPMEAVRHA